MTKPHSPLEPPNSFHVASAQGWVMLGNPEEAEAELRKVDHELREHPAVLEAAWQIAGERCNWEEALATAKKIVEFSPDEATGWIYQAYAVRRTADGGVRQARDLLLPAAGRFPDEPIIPFNLACYECLLGDLDKARDYLRIAFQDSSRKTLKKMARAEADLEPLWGEISKL